MSIDKIQEWVDIVSKDPAALASYTESLNKSMALTPEQVLELIHWELEQDKLAVEIQAKEYARQQKEEECSLCNGTGSWRNAVCIVCQGSKRYTAWGLEKAAFDRGVPFYGSEGGPLTFTFRPTSVGTFLDIKHTITGRTLHFSAV